MKNTITQNIDVDQIIDDVNSRIKSMTKIAGEIGVSKAHLSKFLSKQIRTDAMILRCKAWLELEKAKQK